MPITLTVAETLLNTPIQPSCCDEFLNLAKLAEGKGIEPSCPFREQQLSRLPRHSYSGDLPLVQAGMSHHSSGVTLSVDSGPSETTK